MSITDELRTGGIYRFPSNKRVFTEEELTAIADRIDAAHQKAEDEWKAKDGQSWLHGYAECRAELMEGNEVIAASLEEAGWVKLPVGEDGDVLHIGELVDEQLPFGGYAAPAPVDTMELSRGVGGYGWMVRLDSESGAFINPKLLRHHHAPTVEDVLREFASDIADVLGGDDFRLDDSDELFAEYAAKLRELVRTFYHCTTSGECDECPINGGGPVRLMPDTICDTIHDRMRELGVEV